MVFEYLFLTLCKIWRHTRPCAYILVSVRLFLHKAMFALRIFWISDDLLSVEEGLTSRPAVDLSKQWSDKILMTSKMHSESVSACLIQHGCNDMTDDLEMRQCDQHVFTRGGSRSSVIYRGTLNNGALVAIKCMESLNDRDHGKNLKRAAREVYIWSRCYHQGVLPVLGFARFRGQMALITPWMGAGSLKQHVLRGSLPTPIQTRIQLAVAVQHLHANGIVHGDIKPDNILMTDHGEAQLADFGSAMLTHTDILDFTHTASFNFTLRFAAPEVLKEESCAFTKESDIYALGMTMFNIVSGQLPFSDKSALSFINAVINMKLQPSRPNFNNSLRSDVVKEEMWNLLQRCLTYAPEGRPNANEVKDALVRIEDLNTSMEGRRS